MVKSAGSAAKPAKTDPMLLSGLVCPLTGALLEHNRNSNELLSRAARLAYPVRDGIPVMIASEARPLEEHELKK